MGILQRDLSTPLDDYGTWEVRAGAYLPSGWWVVPGAVTGLGLWALLGYAVVAAVSGMGGGTADLVTQAAPMGGTFLAGR